MTEIHQIPRGVLAPAISDDAEFDRPLFGQIHIGDWRMVIGLIGIGHGHSSLVTDQVPSSWEANLFLDFQ